MLFRVLGPVEIEADGQTRRLSRYRERRLLGVLLLDANRVVPIGRLADLLWEGDAPENARRVVHTHVSRLRAVLKVAGRPGAGLAFVGDGYRLDVDPELVDAHRFRTLATQASAVATASARVGRLRAALGLWRGPLLADAASDWLRARVGADLEEQRLVALEELMTVSLAQRKEREVLPELAQIAGDNPGREALIALHMRALYQADRKVDALGVFARARDYLAETFGIDPGHALRDMHQAILRDELALPASVATGATGPVQPAAAAPAVVPRQLPADIAGFAGRVTYLAQLDGILARPPGEGTSIPIAAIRGAAGVGKTALAVHWSYRVASRFPDGQLYVDLRGFDPTGSPSDPAEAVRTLLEALEVSPQGIPASFDAQVGLYRSLLAGRRMLVLLDNARDAEQVRPLLPGAEGCLAVVTSRDQLTGLAVREGARLLALDMLSPAEARELLEHRLGGQRVAAEPTAVDAIVGRCGGLPLALAVVAGRVAGQPTFPLGVLVERLRAADRSLDSLEGSDPASDVRTVISWSYRSLGADEARLFRLLGLHPGPESTARAAASLAALPVAQTARQLDALVRANLLIEPSPGRYAFHDLLREYATELVHSHEEGIDQVGALHRMFDYYVHAAHAAALLFHPERASLALPSSLPTTHVEQLASMGEAAGWLSVERPVLVAAVAKAGAGSDAQVCWLAWALAPFLDRAGHWRDQLDVQTAALGAARRLADRAAQASAHRFLGLAHARFQQWDDAELHLWEAFHFYTELSNWPSLAAVHSTLGMVCDEQGRSDEALYHAELQVRLARLAKHRHAEATGLLNVGWMYNRLGQYQRAVGSCVEALEILRELGNPDGQAEAWDVLGYAHFQLDHRDEAIACYRRALALFGERSDRYNQAQALARLGDIHRSVGDQHAARTAWLQAAEILDQLGHPAAAEVRGRPDRLATAASNGRLPAIS